MAQPDIVFKHGQCCGAIFSKEITRGDRTFQTQSVLFQKRVKNQRGEWETVSHLDVNDIPKAVLVLQKCYDYLTASGWEQKEEEQ